MSAFSIVARDVHSPLVRNEIWTHLADKWPGTFGIPRPSIGIVSRKNVIEYLIELESWKEARDTLRERIEADPEELAHFMSLSEEWGRDMNLFTQTVQDADLSAWAGDNLISAYKKFAELQARQYAVGALLPLLDIGGESFIESWIKKMLSERVAASQRAEAFAILTTPLKDSFSLEQEKDLLVLAEFVHREEKIKRIIEQLPAVEAWRELAAIVPDFADKIRAHAVKYGWVYYVYQGPAFDEARFVEFIQDFLTKQVDPVQRTAELRAEQASLQERQRICIASLAKNQFENRMLTLASEYVWSKPRRKDYQSRSYFHMESFYRECARRLEVSLRHARAATMEQILSGLTGAKINLKTLELQYQLHVVTNEAGVVRVLFQEEAETFIQDRVGKSPEVSQVNTHVWQGSTAYPGKVKGRVRIVNTPEDMQGFVQGEILVAIATTPSIVPAMKKAAAILTDEGGLTCHAAIVSRELKVPCVVGLKVITTCLHNGDDVEVDAEKGEVHLVSRA